MDSTLDGLSRMCPFYAVRVALLYQPGRTTGLTLRMQPRRPSQTLCHLDHQRDSPAEARLKANKPHSRAKWTASEVRLFGESPELECHRHMVVLGYTSALLVGVQFSFSSWR
jgi:hypothetical protein